MRITFGKSRPLSRSAEIDRARASERRQVRLLLKRGAEDVPQHFCSVYVD
jgi:hypothetical protein